MRVYFIPAKLICTGNLWFDLCSSLLCMYVYVCVLDMTTCAHMQVYYRFSKISMLREPLMCFVAFFTIFCIFIINKRLETEDPVTVSMPNMCMS